MELKYFDNKDQFELLELVWKNYFNHNFGTISKSEFELLLFTFYYEKAREKGLNIDDFSLSVDLGITQNRIRSFKEKMALRNNVFDDDESWKKEFRELVKYAKYDDTKKLFKLHIPDINLLIRLRHTLENLHLYDEYQLNPKLFQCRADVMVELLGELYPEELSDKTINTDITKMKKCAEDKQCNTCLEKLKNGLVKEGLIEILKVCSKSTAVELLKPIPILGSIVSAVL